MLEKSQDIIEFAQDKINALYDEYKGAAPGEYDEQSINGVIAITKHLLDTAVKIEALEKLSQMDFNERHGGTNAGAIVEIFHAILDYQS